MKTIIYFIVLLLLTSCSMQKRKYTNGWDIQWRHSHQSEKNITGSTIKKPASEDTSKLIGTDHPAAPNEPLPLTLEPTYPMASALDTSETSETVVSLSDQKMAKNKKSSQSIKLKAFEWTKKQVPQISKKEIKIGKKLKGPDKNPTKVIGTTAGILIVVFAVLFIILLVVFIAMIRFFNELFSIF